MSGTEYYIHRSGRTGRAGRPGKSITLYDANDDRQCQLMGEVRKKCILLLSLLY